MSVLMVLILVTTIGLGAFLNAFAESGDDGEDSGKSKNKQTEAAAKEKKSTDDSEKDKTEKDKTEKEKTDKDEDSKDEKKKDKDNKDDKVKKDDKTKNSEAVAVKPWTIDDVSSSSYIVMSGSTSEIVKEKHSDRKMVPGRITMLMTAMVVIDNLYNEDEMINNTKLIGPKLASRGQTYREGESVTVADLLSTMLMSGDVQSAEALATYSATSRDIFIKEMNSKAVALGLMDTHFTNPSGEYSTKQYSTAEDCALITQAAYRYPFIRETLEKDERSFKVLKKKARRVVTVRTSNPMMTSENEAEIYKYSKGGIAGYTGSPVNAAQYACVSEKDGMEIIVVLMDSKQDMLLKEAKALLEYGDKHVTKNTIVKKGKLEGHVRVRGGERTIVPAYTETKGYAYVPPEGSEALVQTEVVMQSGLKAPLKKGTKVGEFRIYVADELKGTVDLVVKKDVKKGWPPSQVYISNRAVMIAGAVVLLLLLLRLRVRQINKKKAKLRELKRQQKIRELARQQLVVDEDRRKRNWTFDTGNYDKLPPRTSDIRKEAVDAALREENAMKAQLTGNKTDKKRAELNRRIREKRK